MVDFYSRRYRQDEPRQKRFLLRVLLGVLLIYGCVRIFGDPHIHSLPQPGLTATPPPPIVAAMGVADDASPEFETFNFIGNRVSGNGAYLDLGDRHLQLPASLFARWFPDPMIVSSCLTEPAPQRLPWRNGKLLPVRDDWPGFYGAPWTAWINGNLVALLHVYAPRDAAAPVPAPEFQIYRNYNGQPAAPSFATLAPARIYRGSKAVLYRVFLNGPVRCLDLVVQNGENSGTGHLYYQKYHHYYEVDAKFQIQQ